MDYFVIGNISVVLVAGLTAGTLFTWLLIPILHRLRTGQSIREEGPQSHQTKAGTPTMGGLAIIAATIVGCVVFRTLPTELAAIIIVFLLFGALGFLDDYVKVAQHRNLGLRAYQKLILQIAIGAGLALYQSRTSAFGTKVYIPFVDINPDFGIMYVPFIAFVIVAMANGVNLTDGLDGLAAGVTSMVALFYALLGFSLATLALAGPWTMALSGKSVGHPSMEAGIAMISGGGFCAALTGACLGFLIFNRNPAKIFMGDTGSMALGGGLAAAAVIMNMAMLLPLVGFVYVAEALSVVIQVASYKTRKKRIFKMSPLHHHFELSGLSERQVVRLFWVCTAVLCIIGWLSNLNISTYLNWI